MGSGMTLTNLRQGSEAADAVGLPPGDPEWITVDDGHILEFGVGQPTDGRASVDCTGLLAAPGFVDMHCHGGGGASFSDGIEAGRIAARVHLLNGTTTLMASLVSASPAALLGQIRSLTDLVDDGTVYGIHLEGPWISPAHCGAHDQDVLRPPAPGEIASVLEAGAGRIAMVTLAPELPGGIEAVRQFVQAGVVVAIGHTDASNTVTHAAIDAGATVATHLFNAMPPMLHRDPGPAAALLADGRVTIEVIADLLHLDADILTLALNAAGPGRVALVSDAMAAAGGEDGEYRLGSLAVTVRDGIARLAGTNTLAGSTLTVLDAVRHVVAGAGWPLSAALVSASATPARALGATDRGQLASGARADLVLLDSALALRGVMRAGSWILDPVDSAVLIGR